MLLTTDDLQQTGLTDLDIEGVLGEWEFILGEDGKFSTSVMVS